MSRVFSSGNVFIKLVAVVLCLEIVWFSLMAPLFPSNVLGFVIEACAGVCVFLIVYVSAKAITWLSARQSNPKLAKFAAVVIAVCVGLFIFLAAYEFRAQLSDNFHYFLFSHR